MKLKLYFILIDLLILLLAPFVFLWSTLLQASKALVELQSTRRLHDRDKSTWLN